MDDYELAQKYDTVNLYRRGGAAKIELNRPEQRNAASEGLHTALAGVWDRLAADEAVQAADTVLFTVPNQLGVDYNARILATIADHIAPAIGWPNPHNRFCRASARPKTSRPQANSRLIG